MHNMILSYNIYGAFQYRNLILYFIRKFQYFSSDSTLHSIIHDIRSSAVNIVAIIPRYSSTAVNIGRADFLLSWCRPQEHAHVVATDRTLHGSSSRRRPAYCKRLVVYSVPTTIRVRMMILNIFWSTRPYCNSYHHFFPSQTIGFIFVMGSQQDHKESLSLSIYQILLRTVDLIELPIIIILYSFVLYIAL